MDAVQLAQEIGFDQAAPIRAADVVTSIDLASSCSPKTCPKYGSCWSCPPAAGTFEELQANIASRNDGVLVQTVREDVDYYEDWELLTEIRDEHNHNLDRLASALRNEFERVAVFSTGGCGVCETCTYPDAPCRNPLEQHLSLSAHGVSVGATCQKAGLDYSFENGRIRYVGMILHD